MSYPALGRYYPEQTCFLECWQLRRSPAGLIDHGDDVDPTGVEFGTGHIHDSRLQVICRRRVRYVSTWPVTKMSAPINGWTAGCIA